MIGQEILRLPEIPEGTPEAQLRAIRSYLYRLAEQLQYLLSQSRRPGFGARRSAPRRHSGGFSRKFWIPPRLPGR